MTVRGTSDNPTYRGLTEGARRLPAPQGRVYCPLLAVQNTGQNLLVIALACGRAII